MMKLGPFRWDGTELWRDNDRIDLGCDRTKIRTKILRRLLSSPGIPVPDETIFSDLWPQEFYSKGVEYNKKSLSGRLRTHIKELRKQIKPVEIDRARGRGFFIVKNCDDRLPIPVMLPSTMVYIGVHDRPSIVLDEIVALRPDGKMWVLGYSTLDAEALYTLMAHSPTCSAEALREWGELQEDDYFVYNAGLGFIAGAKNEVKMIVGRSGSKVQFEFLCDRTQGAGGGMTALDILDADGDGE